MNITVNMSNSRTGRTSSVAYFVTGESCIGDAMSTAECYAANDNGDLFDTFTASHPWKK